MARARIAFLTEPTLLKGNDLILERIGERAEVLRCRHGTFGEFRDARRAVCGADLLWILVGVQRRRRYRRRIERLERLAPRLINPSTAVANTHKAETARRWTEDGIPVAPTVRWQPGESLVAVIERGGIRPPFIVREGWTRVGERVEVLDRVPRDARREDWRDPIVVQFMDTRDETGVFRRRRALVAGDRALPLSLFGCDRWYVNGSKSGDAISRWFLSGGAAEAREFLFGPPPAESALLVRSVQVLGLHVGAVDYTLDRDGRPLLFEVNAAFSMTDHAHIPGSPDRPRARERGARFLRDYVLRRLERASGDA